MAKNKDFDPANAKEAAEATIAAATERKEKAQEKVQPFQDRLDRAQKALDAAKKKVTDEDALIARTQAYLNAMAQVDAAAAPVPQPEAQPETV